MWAHGRRTVSLGFSMHTMQRILDSYSRTRHPAAEDPSWSPLDVEDTGDGAGVAGGAGGAGGSGGSGGSVGVASVGSTAGRCHAAPWPHDGHTDLVSEWVAVHGHVGNSHPVP